ncbi:MAG: UDP-N-acetylglucosamine 1-carboxyvinyltransferase [Phycisphaeraceae bacterium]
MDAFVIEGGRRLKGTVRVAGSKNAALPAMAAVLAAEGPVTLLDVPHLSDIDNMARLLAELGVKIERDTSGGTMKMQVVDEGLSTARYDIVRTMRASICVLGPMLAKRGKAVVSMPGGCAIGDRPIDLHLRGLRALGAEINLEGGNVIATAKRLRGARIFLGGPFGSTVLGTANVMSAAVLAEGTTVIEQAACEPEVADLANLLIAMGARISGAGTPRITIEGVSKLRGVEHRIIADRIEAGTLLCAAAITNGDVTVENCPIDAMAAVIDRLEAVGVHIDANGSTDPMRATVNVTCARRLDPITVTTQPHPGFPTDLQAQIMALLTLADGNSIITEKVFPERFLHVAELSRMGAEMYRQGPTVMVIGVKKLVGAPVMASDLRASAGLVVAALAARGITTINRVYHLDRGYDKLEQRLNALGASIERINVPGA